MRRFILLGSNTPSVWALSPRPLCAQSPWSLPRGCLIFLTLCFCLLLTVTPAPLVAAGLQTTSPFSDLRPSYEEEYLTEVVDAGLFLQPAKSKEILHEISIEETFDTIFQRLTDQLPKTGLTVNTANAKTGIITAAMRSANPETLVDLGTTIRTYGPEEFMFPTAAAAEFKLPYYNKDKHYYVVKQATALNCLVNIQLTRLKSTRTKVLVTISYQFTLNTTFENTAFRKSAPPAESKTVTFMTNEQKEVDMGIMDSRFMVIPRSNGRLEQAILDTATGL